MAGRERKWVWVQKPVKVSFDAKAKEKLLCQVREMIDASEKLQKKVSRINMRADRIYLYQLVEVLNPEGREFIVPLIDGKYYEDYYARITIKDAEATDCTADWRRHNDLWMSLYSGTLQECIASIDNDNYWYR